MAGAVDEIVTAGEGTGLVKEGSDPSRAGDEGAENALGDGGTEVASGDKAVDVARGDRGGGGTPGGTEWAIGATRASGPHQAA
jgi:hypothetical protein